MHAYGSSRAHRGHRGLEALREHGREHCEAGVAQEERRAQGLHVRYIKEEREIRLFHKKICNHL